MHPLLIRFADYQLSLLGEEWITSDNKRVTSKDTKDYMQKQYRITLHERNHTGGGEKEDTGLTEGREKEERIEQTSNEETIHFHNLLQSYKHV